jgi:hypothetical protein
MLPQHLMVNKSKLSHASQAHKEREARQPARGVMICPQNKKIQDAYACMSRMENTQLA